jgi:hypothetical protein
MSNWQPTMSGDPLTLAYCAAWDMLENHTGFTGLVAPPNRIKFLQNRLKPTKEIITDTDLPEVGFAPTDGDIHLQASSDRTLLQFGFDVWAATGNQRLDTLGPTGMNGAIFPVLWEMFRAMRGWTTNLLTLQWPTSGGSNFVHLAKPTSVKTTLGAVDKNRNIIGWSALIHYDIYMNFLDTAILPIPPD